jgi:ubiquitin carboxyl-terminal hydrolase 25/28
MPEPKRTVTKRKTAPASSESVMMFGRQHDVAECMDNCMFQIETALLRFDEMAGSESDKTSVVKRLFYGRLKQRITAPLGSGAAALAHLRRQSRASIHEKEDLFSHLPLNVSDEGYDLYDGLSGYFDDVVEFEGKQARMQVSLVDLPPLLQIQLQRVQFDRDTMMAYKSQAYVKFDETIYVDRFLENADPARRRRSDSIQAELRQTRERILELTKGKYAPYGSALASTADFLAKLGSEDEAELAFALQDEGAVLENDVATLREKAEGLKAELESLWQGQQDAAYELTSVFIHRGSSPSWGHYFFYSRNLPDHPDSWFKYNDSEVTEVSKQEVFADTTGSTANPYLLVYARRGLQTVSTVKRFDPATLEEAEV